MTARCRRLLVALLLVASSSSAFADEASTARRFELARRDEPSLIAFLKAMPKGAGLHQPGRVPAARLLVEDDLRYRFLNAASMRGPISGPAGGHDHFFRTFDPGVRARRARLPAVVPRRQGARAQPTGG